MSSISSFIYETDSSSESDSTFVLQRNFSISNQENDPFSVETSKIDENSQVAGLLGEILNFFLEPNIL